MNCPNYLILLKAIWFFIGPRPALFNQHDLIKLRKEHEIDKFKPGITGWAQINGEIQLQLKSVA